MGSKTSLRWENARFSGYRENKTETLLGWCAAAATRSAAAAAAVAATR